MEPRFHDELDLMSHYAKKRQQKDLPDDERFEVEREIQDMLALFAQARETALRDQEQIFSMQEQKQKVMKWLRERLREIDEGTEHFDPKARPIVFRNGLLFWERTDGTTIPVTEGMLLTDGVWDIDYALDSKTVPRVLRKKYYIEKAKRLLDAELNKQIAIDQERSAQTDVERGYFGLIKDRELVLMEGHMAERMVSSYMKKLSIDYDLPFDVEGANIYEDIELKIDFIIRIKTRARGVAVEENDDDTKQTIGIQFTVATRRIGKLERVKKAAKQAREMGLPIDDIVIVKFPLKQLHRLFTAWSANKMPGGPDELWEPEIKEKLFKQILFELFSEQEIDEMWEQIQGADNPFE